MHEVSYLVHSIIYVYFIIWTWFCFTWFGKVKIDEKINAKMEFTEFYDKILAGFDIWKIGLSVGQNNYTAKGNWTLALWLFHSELMKNVGLLICWFNILVGCRQLYK